MVKNIVIAVVTSVKSCAIVLEHGQATPRTLLSFADILWFLILIGSVLWIYVIRYLFVTATPERLLEIAKQAGIDIATASEWIARKPDAERLPGTPSNFA